jgi:uncharacterized protein YggE
MKRNSILIILSILVIGGIALMAFNQRPVLAQDNNPNSQGNLVRTLTVDGTGSIILVPDMAYVNIGVNSEGEQVAEALRRNNELARQIANTLKAAGVEEKDIQTANFNVYPQQRYDNNGQVTGTYFSVSNNLYVTVRNLSKLGELLDLVTQSGANNIYGIQFDIKDRRAVLDQARDLALADAKAKAADVAKVMDVTLTEVLHINTSQSNFNPIPYGMGAGDMTVRSNDSSVPVAAGQIEITFTATLVYGIK